MQTKMVNTDLFLMFVPLEFVVKNYDKIYKNEDSEEIEMKPSITILGIEGVACTWTLT